MLIGVVAAALAVGGLTASSGAAEVSSGTPSISLAIAPTAAQSEFGRAHGALAIPTKVVDGAHVATYLPGLRVQVRVPKMRKAPLVVLIPGGAWATSDPAGLVPLAARLTEDGVTTSLLTYDTTGTGTRFPMAVDEVACGIRWSVRKARRLGHPVTKVIVLGHSAGGQLASLVTFSGNEFGRDCRYPAVTIDGLIGMAGVYNTDWFTSGMRLWMGTDPASAPALWKRVNPMVWLQDSDRMNPLLQTILLHGSSDQNVPYAQTTALADALRAKGLQITGNEFVGLDHMQIIEAGIAEPPIKSWLLGLGWIREPVR
ncbi:MAG: alpha/beta hydrolase [bacterium]|nr:alpha/beta hydrolase [bacterium]